MASISQPTQRREPDKKNFSIRYFLEPPQDSCTVYGTLTTKYPFLDFVVVFFLFLIIIIFVYFALSWSDCSFIWVYVFHAGFLITNTTARYYGVEYMYKMSRQCVLTSCKMKEKKRKKRKLDPVFYSCFAKEQVHFIALWWSEDAILFRNLLLLQIITVTGITPTFCVGGWVGVSFILISNYLIRLSETTVHWHTLFQLARFRFISGF